MRVFLITMLLLAVCIFSADAQKRKKKEKESEKKENVTPQDNAYSPYAEAESAAPYQQANQKKKKSRKKTVSFRASYRKMLDQKKIEFEERMKQNAKEDRREARLMKKPQYSDPSYFGHKRKPKKRKPGKRKLCKECGIVH